MTTKEIAFAVNKDQTTVQRWIKRLNGKMQSIDGKMLSSSPMVPADFNLEETCHIIEAGLGKNAADLYRMNAGEKRAENSGVGESISSRDLDLIAAIVAKTVATTLTHLDGRYQRRDGGLDGFPSGFKALPATTMPPEIPVRRQVTNLVNDYADRHLNGDFRKAWGELYKDFGDRYGMNVTERARNRGRKGIEYLADEGLLRELLMVAENLFHQGRRVS